MPTRSVRARRRLDAYDDPLPLFATARFGASSHWGRFPTFTPNGARFAVAHDSAITFFEQELDYCARVSLGAAVTSLSALSNSTFLTTTERNTLLEIDEHRVIHQLELDTAAVEHSWKTPLVFEGGALLARGATLRVYANRRLSPPVLVKGKVTSVAMSGPTVFVGTEAGIVEAPFEAIAAGTAKPKLVGLLRRHFVASSPEVLAMTGHASDGKGGLVLTIRAATSTDLFEFPLEKEPIALTAKGTTVAVADGRAVFLYRDGRIIGRLECSYLEALSMSDDARFAVTQNRARLTHWDLASGSVRHERFGHEGYVTHVEKSALGDTVLTVTDEAHVHLWSANGKHLGSTEGLWAQYSRDGKTIWVTRRDGVGVHDAQTFDAKSDRVARVGSGGVLERACEAADGSLLVMRNQSGRFLEAWDSAGHLRWRMKDAWNQGAFELLPDGKRFVIATGSDTLTMRDVQTGRVMAPLAGHRSRASLARSVRRADGRLMTAAETLIERRDDGSVIRSWPFQAVCVDPFARFAIDTSRALHRLDDGVLLSTLPEEVGRPVDLSADGKTLFTTMGNAVLLFDVEALLSEANVAPVNAAAPPLLTLVHGTSVPCPTAFGAAFCIPEAYSLVDESQGFSSNPRKMGRVPLRGWLFCADPRAFVHEVLLEVVDTRDGHVYRNSLARVFTTNTPRSSTPTGLAVEGDLIELLALPRRSGTYTVKLVWALNPATQSPSLELRLTD
jgi:hypothetical protein